MGPNDAYVLGACAFEWHFEASGRSMDLSALLCLLKPCTDDASNAKNAPVLAFTSDCDVEHENVQASQELSTACTCSLHPKCAFPGCAVLKVLTWGHEVKWQ